MYDVEMHQAPQGQQQVFAQPQGQAVVHQSQQSPDLEVQSTATSPSATRGLLWGTYGALVVLYIINLILLLVTISDGDKTNHRWGCEGDYINNTIDPPNCEATAGETIIECTETAVVSGCEDLGGPDVASVMVTCVLAVAMGLAGAKKSAMALWFPLLTLTILGPDKAEPCSANSFSTHSADSTKCISDKDSSVIVVVFLSITISIVVVACVAWMCIRSCLKCGSGSAGGKCCACCGRMFSLLILVVMAIVFIVVLFVPVDADWGEPFWPLILITAITTVVHSGLVAVKG